jgi:hypothetical protein
LRRRCELGCDALGKEIDEDFEDVGHYPYRTTRRDPNRAFLVAHDSHIPETDSHSRIRFEKHRSLIVVI